MDAAILFLPRVSCNARARGSGTLLELLESIHVRAVCCTRFQRVSDEHFQSSQCIIFRLGVYKQISGLGFLKLPDASTEVALSVADYVTLNLYKVFPFLGIPCTTPRPPNLVMHTPFCMKTKKMPPNCLHIWKCNTSTLRQAFK